MKTKQPTFLRYHIASTTSAVHLVDAEERARKTCWKLLGVAFLTGVIVAVTVVRMDRNRRAEDKASARAVSESRPLPVSHGIQLEWRKTTDSGLEIRETPRGPKFTF